MKKLITTIIATLMFASCNSQTKVDLTTVTDFDLNRYMGLWYEVARYENWFERGMTNPTATYSIMANGTVRVENSGDKNGIRKTSIGKAKLDTMNGAGALKVAFFLNFYAPYRVLMLDERYMYALVASSDKYLWILSRTPTLDDSTLRQILAQARRLGFDPSRLIYTQTSK